MHMNRYKIYFFFVLTFCLYISETYCIEKIFSEHYKVQEGDNVEKIIQKKIWYENLTKEEKKLITKNIKDWNPQVINWKKLEVGSKLYLEFPRKWSKDFPLITIPIKKLALKKGSSENRGQQKESDNRISNQEEKNKRLPSSKVEKRPYSTKVVYQKNPYNFDLSLGSKLFYYEEPVTTTGTMIATTNVAFDLNLKFDYPVNEKLKFFFGLGGSYYQKQECENSGEIEGYCVSVVTYKFPISYTLKTGLKKALFSSTLNKGFSGLLTVEREGLSYISSNKATVTYQSLKNDGATLLKPNKSLFLWLTLGLDYNFSIWNKKSKLALLGSYCLSGESNLNASDGYWERLEPCFKFNGEYKQYLGKSFWFNSYIKYIKAKGRFDFTGIQNGLNLGYTF